MAAGAGWGEAGTRQCRATAEKGRLDEDVEVAVERAVIEGADVGEERASPPPRPPRPIRRSSIAVLR